MRAEKGRRKSPPVIEEGAEEMMAEQAGEGWQNVAL